MILKKGQSAIEFLILVAALFFFFILFFMAIQSNMYAKNIEKTNLLVKKTAYKIRDEINLALEASEGYSRNFSIPNKIGNKEYNASVNNSMIYLITHDRKHSIGISIRDIEGELQKGENTIEKKNGEVCLNDC